MFRQISWNLENRKLLLFIRTRKESTNILTNEKTQKKAGKRITKSVLDMMRKQKNVFDKVSRTV